VTAQPNSVRQRIDAFNRKRLPELVARKYAKMAHDPFVFFRGTAHLFWEDWPSAAAGLDDAPLAWSCGDLHLENFGSYRGDNGLAYFDLNDFDDAALAPATRDPARFLTSLHLAARSLRLEAPAVTELSASYLDAYATALIDAKARWVERATARGMIRELLQAVKSRTRAELLAARTVMTHGERQLRLIPGHTFYVIKQEQRKVAALIRGFAMDADDPDFYRVSDVVGRIAGTGSLGLRRYVVLVRGTGGSRGHRLLDLKQSDQPAILQFASRSVRAAQPSWRNEADRVVQIQHRMQAIAPAGLAAVVSRRESYMLRELQPTEDRLSLDKWNGRLSRLRRVVATMGHLTAWTQLRSRAHGGSAKGDELIAFGRDRQMRRALLKFARAYAQQVELDWQAFTSTLEDGASAAEA
jgi:uncharacterized protein (DUF2252 family)